MYRLSQQSTGRRNKLCPEKSGLLVPVFEITVPSYAEGMYEN
jgi:hypothetical protein